ncbi:MAG: potassium transporter TrkG [Planctomycetota bacterium]|nr:potassium transporter TrkG [Planctomycetota bacterium]
METKTGSSSGKQAEELSRELNEPGRPARGWRRVLLGVGRVATWVVLVPPRRGMRVWTRLRAPQQLVLGFAWYVVAGWLLLCLPVSQAARAPMLDHLFTAASAVSTTGLTTVSVAETYTTFGEVVVLALFQLGGLGFMTLSSVLVLARGGSLSASRAGVLRAGFSVPHYFVLSRFIVHVVAYTAVVEAIGAGVLWWRFSELGVERPLWSAVFHSVSAFATAGFSLHNTSLEAYAGDWVVNVTVGCLCLFGAMGFIVFQDLWYSFKFRERMITFTTKVIVTMTLVIMIGGAMALFFIEPREAGAGWHEHLLVCGFQMVSASTTAGFNTTPIGGLSNASLVVIMLGMMVGASPSGTGGGMKTTTMSALCATVFSILRGRETVRWIGHEVPAVRLLQAVAAATVYLVLLWAGVAALSLTEEASFLALAFEAASAIGTVGLSMGVTGDLSWVGKVIVIGLMFAGRCGPLTLGLALLRPEAREEGVRRDDLAV